MISNTQKLVSMFSGMLLLGSVSAQSAVQFSLKEAQAYGVENSYVVKNARMDAEAARRQVKETIAIGLPQLNGTIDYQNFIDIPTQIAPADAFGFPGYLTQFLFDVSQETGVALNAPEADPNAITEFQFGTPQTMTAGLSLTQLIFDGSYFVGLQAARAYADVMNGAIDLSAQQVKDQIAQAYHTVLIAEENVKVLEESIVLMQKLVNETNQLFSSGFLEEQDVEQLQLSLNDLYNRVAHAKNQRLIAMKLLKFQLGLDFSTELVLTDTVQSLMAENVVDLASTPYSFGNTINHELLTKQIELMELNVKNERARGLPSIGGFYNYQRNAQRDEFNFLDFDRTWYPTQLWGLQLKMPIWTSMQGKHRVERARIDLERAKLQREQTEESSELEYQTALSDFQFSKTNLENQQQSLNLAKRIFEKTQIKYTEGVASSMDLTTAENQYLASQGNLINATLQLLNAKSRLMKALDIY
jgi:outer membrane protein